MTAPNNVTLLQTLFVGFVVMQAIWQGIAQIDRGEQIGETMTDAEAGLELPVALVMLWTGSTRYVICFCLNTLIDTMS